VPPPDAGVTKRWRFRRNVVIFIAHAHGVSQRDLADVFDLPQSRISAIVREIARALGPDRQTNPRAHPSGAGGK
jgi:hypothetical protein